MKHMFRHGIITKADFLLIAAVLIAASVILSVRMAGRTEEGWVVISRNGVEEVRLSLKEDTRLLLRDEEGNENLLIIKEESVWIEEADCPDGLCVRQGHISHSGDSIICLPHRLVVTIEGTEKDISGPDAVVYYEKNGFTQYASGICPDFGLCGNLDPTAFRHAGDEIRPAQSGGADHDVPFR